MIEKIGDILMQTRLPGSDKTRKKTRHRKFYLWKFFFDIDALLCLHVDIDALLYCLLLCCRQLATTSTRVSGLENMFEIK